MTIEMEVVEFVEEMADCARESLQSQEGVTTQPALEDRNEPPGPSLRSRLNPVERQATAKSEILELVPPQIHEDGSLINLGRCPRVSHGDRAIRRYPIPR